MSELYRDYIDGKADEILTALGGTITPAPANAELYRDFLDRKFDDVINAIGNVKVKSLTYVGDGINNYNTIKFPTIPKVILSIQAFQSVNNEFVKSTSIEWGITSYGNASFITGTYGVTWFGFECDFNNDEITITALNRRRCFNTTDTYTVYYI